MEERVFKESEIDDATLGFIKFIEGGKVKKTYNEKIKDIKSTLLYKNNSEPVLLTAAENVDIIFKGLGLDKVFAFDEFTQKIYQLKKLPWSDEEILIPVEFSETVFTELSYELNLRFEFSKKSLLRDAIFVHAKKNKINLVQRFIKKEQWDGIKRVETIFIDYLGANDSEYVREVTNLFFKAAVGRAFNPGCKYDYMHILVGPQGIHKSSIIQRLAADWYSSGPPSFEAKIGGEYVKSSWIVEIDELIALKNSSTEEVKTFITRLYDEFRPTYGKLVERFARRCVFIGTTNEFMFLKDKTGNRRYLPIVVGENKPIKKFTQLSSDELTQIWAEAFAMYEEDSYLDLTERIKAMAEKIRENHIYYDPMEGAIEEYLNMPRPDNWEDLLPEEKHERFKLYLSLDEDSVWDGELPIEICPVQIHSEAFGKFEKQINSYESKTIGQALVNLGWTLAKQKRKRIKYYGQQKLYIKSNEDPKM